MNNFVFSKRISLKEMSLVFLLGILVFSSKAQSYFSKKNVHYFDQFGFSVGMVSNQALHYNSYYKPNNKIQLNLNVTPIRLNHFSLHANIGFRQKSLIGYGNYSAQRLFENHPPMPISNYSRSYNIDFSYLNADLFFKITILQKYKFQPFVFIGARYNKILAYSDSLEIYNKFQSFPFTKRDNYINSFFGLGCNYEINTQLKINVIFEENNDMDPLRAVYFNSNPGAIKSEIRFLSYSFQFGIQYTFPQVEYKLKKPMETEIQ